MTSAPRPTLLVFGAHPDDCEESAGGLGALWAGRGGRVCFVSLTNGDAGHHELGGAALARRRRDEAAAAAAVVGAEWRVLDNHDGELLPTLDRRREVIALIREVKPDVVLAPRPYDYHPDHRALALLVQDAAYMVTVPNVVAHAPHLAVDPVILYVGDDFRRPAPLAPDLVVDIDPVADAKLEMLDRHRSQVYEWLPFNVGTLAEVPTDPEERKAWLRHFWPERWRRTADRFREALVARYGAERGARIRHAEAFEVCEYGSPLTPEAWDRLFPV